MKKVYIVRHGKAESTDHDASDYDRTLVERGRHDVERIAEKLKKKGIIPSLIISSPAPRAIETATIFADCYEISHSKIITRKALYEQTSGVLKNVIKELDNELDSVMIVGHEPLLSEFAHSRTDSFNAHIPTSGVVGIDYSFDTWLEVAFERGALSLFVFPGKKEIEDVPETSLKHIDKRLTELVLSFLAVLDQKSAEKLLKTVTSSCKSIAKEFEKSMEDAEKSKKKKQKKHK